MPIQGLKFNIPTSTEQHLSFQATGSFTAYNPNDGYALVALDRTATLLDYDHKLPSQSGGEFPGPINSYLSMYYVDQSGSGVPGQVIVYAMPQALQIPRFWSIGRAIQTQVTSVDFVQGVQPPNPPANTTRLWVDSNGHLNVLQSNGTSYNVLDSNNAPAIIGGTALGADLYGTVNAGHVGVRNNSSIEVYDSGGTLRPYTTFGTEVLYWDAMGGGFRWVNQANTIQWASLGSSGLFVNAGNIASAGNISSNSNYYYYSGIGSGAYSWWSGSWIGFNGGSGILIVGTTFWLNNGSVYLQGSGSTVTFSGAIAANASISMPRGNMLLWGDANTNITGDTSANINLNTWTQLVIHSIGYNTNYALFSNTGQTLYGNTNISGGNLRVGNGITASQDNLTTWGILLPQNATNNGGLGIAVSWNTYSSEKIKTNVSPLRDPIAIVLNDDLHAQEYDQIFDPHLDPNSLTQTHSIGLMAEQWSTIVPEIVANHPDSGEPAGIDYGRVAAIVFEALKEYMLATNKRLDSLERHITYR